MQMQLVEVIDRVNASQIYISSFIIFDIYKVIRAKCIMYVFGKFLCQLAINRLANLIIII